MAPQEEDEDEEGDFDTEITWPQASVDGLP